ncbi:Putative alpha-1,2-mannosidase [Filimonas lacunae]|uniref:Putative alpha-1,2-mannosidase n=1 Tax=Filimonas lacunae TaxID=477680 RepID=A0A173MDZ1_9BACT|nr:glycoside hydrolase domain-containing protein [Filimonas lacunae]BAV05804.1 alpha-1,2-mannosidase [Filimonas lacunae]SIT28564.1 Putative alpha-1,2-mannosidase [Filimonas lacunae]
MKKYWYLLALLPSGLLAQSKTAKPVSAAPASLVNVFLGSSGDHGQLSPAASYPFSMMSIGPQTYPNTHTGYEHNAVQFLGFTHNRMEGVGCMGSGGNLLVKPFLGKQPADDKLVKAKEQASPGYYSVAFANKVQAEFTVQQKQGRHHYRFPAGDKGLVFNLAHHLANRFVAETHTIEGNALQGWIETGTTCNAGIYRVYYYLVADKSLTWKEGDNHTLTAMVSPEVTELNISVGFSSVNTDYAKAAITSESFAQCQQASVKEWNKVLGRIQVTGDNEKEALFYSLLYRTVQSPYNISEPDGTYRGNDGSLQRSTDTMYNGWAIWDNYRTQLPLLSLTYPEKYRGMINSIAGLYQYGKQDYATDHEPSNTVRTEHAVVVLLDACRKGYPVAWEGIIDSLIREVDSLDYSHPDKALESSYDTWALSQILALQHKTELSEKYKQKALQYRDYWTREFKDLTRNDVDRMQARGMYQGTIWQYRWFVPFDVKGLQSLMGGEDAYIAQLDRFFENDYYNHANEPDIQAPYMYNASAQPWKSQYYIHKYAADTVVQYYFNDNSRGIDPFVDRIYKNVPNTYIRTMDDDAGAMSAWYVLAASGLSPACVGWPVYYLSVPLFPTVTLGLPGNKAFAVQVKNFAAGNKYIQAIEWNGKAIHRNWLTQDEIMAGGKLVITASDKPDTGVITDKWISTIDAAGK